MQKQDKKFSVDSAFLPRGISGLYRISEAAAYRNAEYLKYQEDIPTLEGFDISILHTTSRGRGVLLIGLNLLTSIANVSQFVLSNL